VGFGSLCLLAVILHTKTRSRKESNIVIEYIKSFLIGAFVIAVLIAFIGGIVELGIWCSDHLNPLVVIGGLALISFLYFTYQLGKEIRRWND
jgi:hypothetical protein